MLKKNWKLAVCIVVPAIISLITPPTGLEAKAWYVFSLYIAAILGLMLQHLNPFAGTGRIEHNFMRSLLKVNHRSPPQSAAYHSAGKTGKHQFVFHLLCLLLIHYRK